MFEGIVIKTGMLQICLPFFAGFLVIDSSLCINIIIFYFDAFIKISVAWKTAVLTRKIIRKEKHV